MTSSTAVIVPSPSLCAELRNLCEEDEELSAFPLENGIDTCVFQKLSALCLRRTGKSLLSAMRGNSRLEICSNLPPKSSVTDSEEKKKRREYLQRIVEEREYKSMLTGLDNYTIKDEEYFNKQVNSLRQQMTISFNMVVSVFATFGMATYLARHMGFSNSKSMIIGLFASIAIMVLEMVLFIVRHVYVDEAPKKKTN